ncbi:MAG: hypothetical protein RIR51_970 [Bacteroidota bacterium]|jgi:short-subunit dehydrogenase
MKYAVITGASKGIGKAIAFELAKRNYNLLLSGRNLYDLKQLAETLEREYQIDVKFLGSDLADPKGAERLFNWAIDQKVDIRILVNNAGSGLVGKFESYSNEEYLKMIQLNCQSVISLCNYFYPALIGKGDAHILNIASSSAYQSVPYLSVYAATKSFVLSFSRGIYNEWKKRGLFVTATSPGPTITNFNESANVPEKIDKAARSVAMSAEDVARISVKAMFNKKPEKVIGIINQFGAIMAKWLPKSIVEGLTLSLYK